MTSEVLISVFLLVQVQNKCLDTSLLCNNCTESCKIWYGQPFESSISFPQSFYNDTNGISIEIKSFEIYLKASHFHQFDLIFQLHLGASTVELFNYIGYNRRNIDVTLGDNFTIDINDISDLNCKCEAKPENSIINGIKDSILINSPLILNITDINIKSNGTFDNWCIKKFCYSKLTAAPTKMTLNPSVNPTRNPVNYKNVYNFKLGAQEIIFYITIPLIVFLTVVIVICCFCYKINESKNRKKQESYSNTIVNVSPIPRSAPKALPIVTINNNPLDRLNKRTDSGIGSDLGLTEKIEKEGNKDGIVENNINELEKTIEGSAQQKIIENLVVEMNEDRNRSSTVDSTYRHVR